MGVRPSPGRTSAVAEARTENGGQRAKTSKEGRVASDEVEDRIRKRGACELRAITASLDNC